MGSCVRALYVDGVDGCGADGPGTQIYRTVNEKSQKAFNVFYRDENTRQRIKLEFAVEDHTQREP